VLPSWRPYLNAIRGLFLIGVPHVESTGDRDRLELALRPKVRAARENILSMDMISKIRLSAKRFATVLSRLGPDLFVVSAYGIVPTKGTFPHVFRKSTVVSKFP
jgi:hypothetical protein